MVSVLFSEPKIPQFVLKRFERAFQIAFQCSSASRKFLNRRDASDAAAVRCRVSVLFSEPKIPQWEAIKRIAESLWKFQCSSASRKFLNSFQRVNRQKRIKVSVLFSEPKIPQCQT